MLNFIVYEDEQRFRDKYFSIIDSFIGESKLAYEIIELKRYDEKELQKLKKASGSKIYILDIEVPGKSGLDFAREIRSSGDWMSQIIIITSHDDLKNFDYQSEMLMLAFISKFYNIEEELLKAIRKAHNILTTHEVVSFQKGNQTYHFPKHEILFIEKQYDELQCFVVTKEDKILGNKTLKQWEKELESDSRFQKTHRNYIVNTYNIRSIDYDKNEVYFENKKVALLSKNYRKQLKEKMNKR